jgi:transcriptional regulator GlxA family with amidase domain
VPGVKSRNVVLVAFEDVRLLNLTGPLEVFDVANTILRSERAVPYRHMVVSRPGGAMRTSSGVKIFAERLSAADNIDIDTLILPGGPGVHGAAEDRDLVAWLVSRAPQVRRVCSVCTGTFLLAATGLLSGRRAATHWQDAERLQELYPDITVESDPIFVHDGQVWTSAGATASIDLTLALIQEDLGHAVAMQAAKMLVVYLRRAGGQSQFSVPLSLQTTASPEFASLHAWMRENIGEKLDIESLADRAAMSPRNFQRVYTAKVGRTPAKTVELLRLEAACRALEHGALRLKQIAVECGFGDERRLRRAFHRQFGVNPLDYRDRFSSHLAAPERIGETVLHRAQKKFALLNQHVTMA